MICCNISIAQQPIDELITSEKNFAKTSREQSTKKAFLDFVDSNCVGFSSGGQVNVFKEWMQRNEDGSKLTWAPEFAIISSSSEMGVTTGPWEYREKSLQDTAVAYGHFTTVWKKNKEGKWKAVFDMGIQYPQKNTNDTTVKKFVLSDLKNKGTGTILLMNTEVNFISAFATDKNAAIKKAVIPESWFSINGYAPFKNIAAINAAIDVIPANTKFTSINMFTSGTNDMFAVYGNAQTGNTKQNYLRVWIKQGEEWKLLMMVMH